MDDFLPLIAACAAFVLSHFFLSAVPVRKALIKAISAMGFMGLYSAVALSTFVWMIEAFATAPDVNLWPQGTTFARHLALGLMPLAFVLLVGGYTVKNPTAVFLEKLARDDHEKGLILPGIIRITRHPVMWAVAIWAILHIIARGDIAGMIFFGSLAFLSIAGAWHIDQKRRHIWGEAWQAVMNQTSSIPFAAVITKRTSVSFSCLGWWRIALGLVLYGVVVFGHGPVIGISLMPQG